MRNLVLLACALVLFPASATAQIEAINPCVLDSTQAVSNLVACGIKLNALGGIALTVKNLGTVGINTPTTALSSPVGSRTTTPPAPPIQIDVSMGGQKIESVYVPSLKGNELKTITVTIPSNYTKPKCAETRTLKLVVDPLSKVTESSEADNTRERTTDRPCPDMAIEYIDKNWNNLKTEFVAKIKLVNKGNAPAKFRYMALTSNSNDFGPLPSADFDKWMEIEPGQSNTFNIGNAFATQRMYVRVFLDRWSEVDELKEDNNFKEETLNN